MPMINPATDRVLITGAAGAIGTALRDGLRDAGYVEGRNLRLEIRTGDGRPALQSENAAKLVRLKVDLIVTFFTPTALAAKQATREIPIAQGRQAGRPAGRLSHQVRADHQPQDRQGDWP